MYPSTATMAAIASDTETTPPLPVKTASTTSAALSGRGGGAAGGSGLGGGSGGGSAGGP